MPKMQKFMVQVPDEYTDRKNGEKRTWWNTVGEILIFGEGLDGATLKLYHNPQVKMKIYAPKDREDTPRGSGDQSDGAETNAAPDDDLPF